MAHAVRRLCLAVCLVCAIACHQLPADRQYVDEVELENADSIDEDELREGLATRGTPHFLGILPEGVVFEYEVYDRGVLEQDLQRIEQFYRARGYYEAKVTAARVIADGEETEGVRVEVRVTEGPPVVVSEITISGTELVPVAGLLALDFARRTLREGMRFDEELFERTKQNLANIFADRGYAYAKVYGKAHVDLLTHQARIDYRIEPGPSCTYGDVIVAGLEEVPEGPVRDTLQIEKGERYSREELELAKNSLFDLGVFSRVDIEPDLSDPKRKQVPIRVVVQESTLRALKIGGGVRFDVLRLATHLRLGWEHRNFLGGLRHLSIELRPGATFFPTRIDAIQAPTTVLPENSIQIGLRQPSFLEGRTTGFTNVQYNVYPLLYRLPQDADPDQEPIIGYNEIIASTGLERSFFSRRLALTTSYNWQANFPFNYQNEPIVDLDPVIVSFPEILAALDFRNDPIETKRGIYLSTSFQVANPLLFGTVTDFRVQPEFRGYVPIYPRRDPKVILATRVTLGFVFPQNYGTTLDPSTVEGSQARLDPTNAAVVQDQQKLLFRAFYSGGPNSNRGYGFREVGPHGPIGFLIPTGEDCRLFSAGMARELPSTCIRPLGGFSLWEASLELRFPMGGPLRGAIFADASDVSTRAAYISVAAPHISIGPGIRYATPIGPVRLDVGWPVPGLQVLRNDQTVLDVTETESFQNRTLPVTLHLVIGEAF